MTQNWVAQVVSSLGSMYDHTYAEYWHSLSKKIVD